MNTVKFIHNFVNRNPRNLEKLRLKPKPSGWVFEKNQNERNSTYRVEFTSTRRHTSGHIIHCEDGVVLSASTKEPTISAQLYSCSDVNAAHNIGRLLARRCQMAGITEFYAPAFVEGETSEAIEGSKRRLSFFHALNEAGVRLTEAPTIPHNHLNDPDLTWESFVVKETRETKLDDLDLSLEPGKGVC